MEDVERLIGDVDALDEDEKLEARKALMAPILAPIAAQNDNPIGMAAFFFLMEGFPLHSEGDKWVKNSWEAHDRKLGLLQECHRESGKTTVFSKNFLLFRIGHEPEKVNMVVRINDIKANSTTAAVGHIIEHDPHWALVFPDIVPDKDKGWGAEGYNVRRESMDIPSWTRARTLPEYPSFVGYGWKSGSIIGHRINGVCIVDDIHDEDNTRSPRQMTAVKKFYTDTLEYCLMSECWELWNFTPWVYNDLYAYLKETGEYLHSRTPVMLPANEGDDGATFWPPMPLILKHPEAGSIPFSNRWWSLYWPEQWPFERIASKYRKSGAVGFARMMLLDLEAAKGVDLKAEWIHYYDSEQIDPSWPVYFGIDYASTADKLRNKDRDYFVLAVMRAIPGGGLVLVDGYRGHVSKGEALKKTIMMAGVYPTLQTIGVESIGTGEEYYNDLALTNDISGQPLYLVPIKHGRKSKGARFEDWLAPRFMTARIWVSNASTPFIAGFLDEWLPYPNGAHDDRLDGVYMAAVAGEGALPIKGQRSTGRREQEKNPFLAFGRT